MAFLGIMGSLQSVTDPGTFWHMPSSCLYGFASFALCRMTLENGRLILKLKGKRQKWWVYG